MIITTTVKRARLGMTATGTIILTAMVILIAATKILWCNWVFLRTEDKKSSSILIY
jgi:hypothetical protein